jgi:hypothetical protein
MTATNSRGQPLKTAQYLMAAQPLADAVAAYRAARDEASAEEPVTQSGEPAPVPTKPKRKSYPLAPLATPTEIPGFPLNPPRDIDLPDYGNIGRVKATRATQAERRGKRAPVTPIGPSELRKARDVPAWKVAE